MEINIETSKRGMFRFSWGPYAYPSLTIGGAGGFRFSRAREGAHKSLYIGRKRIFFLSPTLIGIGTLSLKKNEATGKWRRKKKESK